MRLQATRTSVTSTGGAGDALYRAAGSRPTLDQRFAKDTSLVDKVSDQNLITFSRASSGTYVDSDGLIKTSAVNLVYPSESIDDGVGLWTTTAASGTISVTPNFTKSPYGTNTATRVVATKTGTGYSILQTRPYIPSTPGVGSIWIKSNTGSNQTIYFRLDLGGTEDYNLTVTPEWKRYQMIENESAGLTYFSVGLRGGSDDSCDISIWGAQLEEGTTATDYIPTGATISGAPRFDHDPVTGESLGLLIEESRTNLFIDSLFGSAWLTSSIQKKSTNNPAPDGTNTAVLIGDATSGTTNSFLQVFLNTVDGNPKTFTFYAKGTTTGQSAFIDYYDAGANRARGSISLDDGAVSYFVAATGGAVITSTDAGNGWWRCQLTLTPAGASTFSWRVGNYDSGDIYIWGAQVESGTFPTSYIPTTGSTVTRSPDIATIEGNKFAKTNLLTYSERFDQSAWNKANITVTSNNTVAPDGTATAELVLDNTVLNSHQVFQTTPTLNSSTAYTFSVYAKAASLNYCFLLFYSGGGAIANSIASFDLVNNTSSNAVGSPVTSIKDVGDGWKRISITATTSSSATTFAEVRLSQDGVWSNQQYSGSGQGIYLWGAQLEEGDELTEYTPSVETFDSRASSATYVDDATGLIKTTPVNYLINSNDLSTWSPAAGTVAGNQVLAPDGTLTGAIVTSTGGGITQTPSGAGSAKVLSAYFKDLSGGAVRLGSTADSNRVFFDSNFNITSQDTNVLSATFEDAPNGWKRLTIVASTAFSIVLIYGTSGQTFAVWGAQLEEGTTATDYIPTGATISGAARYENGELLLEPARTNTVLNSDVVTGSSLGSNIVQSLENTISPRGVSESVRKLSFGAAGFNVWRVGHPSSGTPNTTYAISFWAKTVNGGSTSFNVDINDFIPVEGLSTTVDGEWRRYVKVGGARNETFRFFDINILDTTEPVYIWGAQIEAAPYATSYIPTSGSSVTRAADVSTSALGVDSWYNQSEGTVFYEASAKSQSYVALFNSGSFNSLDPRINVNVISGSLGGGGRTQVNVSNIQFDTGNNSTPSYSLGTIVKQASALQADNFAHCFQGGTVITDNSGTMPSTLSRVSIGSNWLPSYLNGHISRLAYFSTRLSDDKLESITT